MGGLYTPGPWALSSPNSGGEVEILGSSGGTHVEVIGVVYFATDGEGTANAHLIERAPELLTGLREALVALAMCVPRTAHGAKCQQNALLNGRAIIARAGGDA